MTILRVREVLYSGDDDRFEDLKTFLRTLTDDDREQAPDPHEMGLDL
jgi:hypothetical protein